MKFIKIMKDGGPESKVSGLYFIEIKSLFTVVLLYFSDGTRDAYHNHAFNAVSWLLKGCLRETLKEGGIRYHFPSWKPIFTSRSCFHQVYSHGGSWALSFRGPWSKTWKEFIPGEEKYVTLQNGRKVVGCS